MIIKAKDILQASSKIVSFSGAGLSAESGVGTFRDKDETGLWSKFDPMKLASPQGFAEDPQTVIDWYSWRRKQIAEAKPNQAHIALALRDDIIHVTQNVDELLERAGADFDKVIHLHGRIGTDKCHGLCGYSEIINLADPPQLRDCPECGKQMRPGVVWFGESLPMDEWAQAEEACTNCDTLLVIGTSAVVYPAAGLIALAKSIDARIIIVNTEASGASHLADVELIGTAGEIVTQLLG